ncbi:hypothetical protein AB0C07_09300 [Actinoplanes missouriensis]|uniref:hypothetical protein n=1 Tax=Actinoplanes missouriensis TaxID=1866 RepID=UPI0033DA4D84
MADDVSMRMTGKKWIVAGIVAVLLGCAAPALLLRHGYDEAKDRRDLSELTRGWNRPLDELRVPDEMPADRFAGDISAYGMDLSFPATDDAAPVTIAYSVRLLDGGREPLWSAGCDAVAVRVCTDMGDGYTLLKDFDTGNSDPATAVRKQAGDLMFEAGVDGDRPEMVERLRRIITETHVPDDAELLRLLRPDGYRTDWS